MVVDTIYADDDDDDDDNRRKGWYVQHQLIHQCKNKWKKYILNMCYVLKLSILCGYKMILFWVNITCAPSFGICLVQSCINVQRNSIVTSFRAAKLRVDRRIDTRADSQTDASNDNSWRSRLASGNYNGQVYKMMIQHVQNETECSCRKTENSFPILHITYAIYKDL